MIYKTYTIGGELYHSDKGGGIKARVHKYIDKIRTKTGKWRYIYEVTKNYKKNKKGYEDAEKAVKNYAKEYDKAASLEWTKRQNGLNYRDLHERTKGAAWKYKRQAAENSFDAGISMHQLKNEKDFKKLYPEYKEVVSNRRKSDSNYRTAKQLNETSKQAYRKFLDSEREMLRAREKADKLDTQWGEASKRRDRYFNDMTSAPQYKVDKAIQDLKRSATLLTLGMGSKKKKKKK